MKLLKLVLLISTLSALSSVSIAEEPPGFYKNTYPEHALVSRMQAEAVLIGEKAKLDAKTRELIALGVAAQVPCRYCVYAHSKNAREAGASEAEIREAVAMAAHVRHWSTILNGMAYDFENFKAEFDKMHSEQ